MIMRPPKARWTELKLVRSKLYLRTNSDFCKVRQKCVHVFVCVCVCIRETDKWERKRQREMLKYISSRQFSASWRRRLSGNYVGAGIRRLGFGPGVWSPWAHCLPMWTLAPWAVKDVTGLWWSDNGGTTTLRVNLVNNASYRCYYYRTEIL